VIARMTAFEYALLKDWFRCGGSSGACPPQK